MKRISSFFFFFLSVVLSSYADNTSYSWSSNGKATEFGGSSSYENGAEGQDVINQTMTVDGTTYYVIKISGIETDINDTVASKNAGYVEIKLNNSLGENDTIIAEGFVSMDDNTSTAGLLVMGYADNEYKDSLHSKNFPNIYYDKSEQIDWGKDGNVPIAHPIPVKSDMVGSNILRLTRTSGSNRTLCLTKFAVKKYIKQPKILSVVPASGDTIKGFDKYSELVFSTNIDDECDKFNVSIIDDSNSDECIYEGMASPNSDKGNWVLSFSNELTFIEGNSYTVKLQGVNGTEEIYDALTFKYYGSTSYPYSDVTITKQQPDSTETIKDASDNTVVVTFSGSAVVSKVVIVDEEGNENTSATFTAANSDNTQWNVTIPTTVLTNSTKGFSLKLYAKDANGKIIGTTGGEDAYTTLSFLCNIPREITVSPSNSESVTSLQSFTFSYSDGLKFQGDDSSISVSDGITTYSGTLSDDGTTYTLGSEITTAGTYTLSIAEGTFSLGSKGYTSAAVKMAYEVEKKVVDYHVTVSPAAGSTLSVLDSITITFDDYESGITDTRALYKTCPVVVNEKGDTIVSKSSCTSSVEGTSTFGIKLSSAVQAEGTYTLKIPAGIIYLVEKAQSVEDYTPNEAMEFEYVISPEAADYGSVTISPSIGSTVKQLDSILVRFEDSFSVTLLNSATMKVYDISNDTTDTGIIATIQKAASNRKNLYIYLNKDNARCTLTTNGIYTFTLPKSCLSLSYVDGTKLTYELEMVFTYTVDKYASSIENVNIDDNDDYVTVYNLQGVKVAAGRKEEVTQGLKGLYIINGKKVVL